MSVTNDQTPALTVQQRGVNTIAVAVIEALQEAFERYQQPNGKALVCGLPLDQFLALSDYTSNRESEKRAIKAGKKEVSHLKGDLSVPQQVEVKVAYITREHCPRTWLAVANDSQARGVPCTLPFVILDAHTRKYAWQLTTKDGYQLQRPESVDAIIYSKNILGAPITDDDFFKMVEAECSKETAATVSEINEMAVKEAGLSTLKSDFCLKSWTNPAGIFAEPKKASPKEIRTEFAEGFLEIDKLNLPYTAPKKTEGDETSPELKARFSGGIKAAILYSFRKGKTCGIPLNEIVSEFWADFYAPWLEGEGSSSTEGAVAEIIKWIENPQRTNLKSASVVDINKATVFNRAVFLAANAQFDNWCNSKAA